MTLREHITSKLTQFAEHRAQKKLYAHPEIKAFLESVISPSTGCSYSDYWLLYSYVIRNRPKEVLELGSGISTVLLAFAARETKATRITSMEESEHYYAATEKIIPADLRSYVDLVHSPAQTYTYGPLQGTAYTSIPEREYDFVFVDGPQYDAENSFDADILALARRQEKPFTYIVDSRTGSCLVYHLAFSGGLRFDYLKRKAIGTASRSHLRTYTKIVAEQMKQHLFPRAFL